MPPPVLYVRRASRSALFPDCAPQQIPIIGAQYMPDRRLRRGSREQEPSTPSTLRSRTRNGLSEDEQRNTAQLGNPHTAASSSRIMQVPRNEPTEDSLLLPSQGTCSPSAASENSNNSEKSNRRSRRFNWQMVMQLLRYGWVIEALSCALAVLCLTAILTTLAIRQNGPLPEWPLHITINALISVFTTLLKTGVTVPLAEGSIPILSLE